MIASGNIMTGITSCENRIDRRDVIRETYFSLLPSPFFFTGRPGHEATIRGDVLYLDAPDSYEKLHFKMWRLYQFLIERFKFDYFLKLDDDCVPDLTTLYALLLSIYTSDERPDYIGGCKVHVEGEKEVSRTYHYGKVSTKIWEKPYTRSFDNDYLSGGHGVLLSRRSIEYVVEYGMQKFADEEDFVRPVKRGQS